ncbi:SsgA family sporulation/cell division regulator [Streptomyces nogalater]|uniref:SsgA family sporulation/cell division regulator n=1 Tax=Streptomyces nogalater TaxID=38314 RepID=A0ABW0WTJ5_STRNO
MPTTTADKEFDALMAASSLRAPRVRALDEPIPEEVQRQLHAAAVADPARTHHDHAVGEPDHQPAVSEDSDDSERKRLDNALDYQLLASRLILLLGFPARGDWRTAQALLLDPSGSTTHGSRCEDVLNTAHTVTSLLRARTPSKPMLHTLLDRRLRDLLSASWQITAPALHYATGTSEVRTASTLMHECISAEWAKPAAFLIAHRARACRLASAASELERQEKLRVFVEMADCGIVNPRESIWKLRAQPRDHSFTAHAARIRLQTWSREELWSQVLEASQRVSSLLDAGKEINSFTTVTPSVSRCADRSTGGHHRMLTARMTELLHPPHLSPLYGLRPWLSGGREPQPAHPHTGICPHEAGHWLVSGVAAGRLAVDMAHPPILPEREVPAGMPRPGEAQPDAVMDQTYLLVAADLAVDLDPAHRQAIPAQPPPLPDLDAYARRPGSTLLLPRKIADSMPGCRQEVRQTVATESGGQLKLWRRKEADGLEQHAQLWMRLHATEGDKGQRFPARLAYRTTDPYAITAVFNHGTDDEREWLFARELLVDGLYKSVGIGDVIVWPSADEVSPHSRVFIRLRSPDGSALLSASRDDIQAFLEASHPLTQVSTASSETCSLKAWERELAELFCREED